MKPQRYEGDIKNGMKIKREKKIGQREKKEK